MMPKGSIEREVKLGGAPGFVMPDLESLLPDLRVIGRPALDLDATYFDTADLRLVREGVSLRRRTGDGAPTWTLKLPAGPAGAALERREFDVVSGATEIPEELRGLVTGWVRSARLEAVIDILSHRERLVLVDAAGVELLEIDEDEVRVREAGEIVARFREIEIELLDDDSSGVMALVTDALIAAGAGAPDPMSKVTRALGPRAAVPSPLEVITPRRDASMGEVLAASMRTAISEIITSDPVIRLDQDPLAVHRARWAVRRLRADLRAFSRFIDGGAAIDALRTELRWLADELGALRRADVLLERVRAAAATMAASDAEPAQALVARAVRERGGARSVAMDAISSERYRLLLDTVLELAVPTRLVPGSTAAVEAIPSTMLRLWKRARAAVRELSDVPTTEEVREVRRQVIRLRSAAESATPIFGAAASDFAGLTAAVQRDLGEYLDARICERWIRERVQHLDGLEPFVAGQLVAAQSMAAEEALRRWIDSWGACSGRSAVGWFRS